MHEITLAQNASYAKWSAMEEAEATPGTATLSTMEEAEATPGRATLSTKEEAKDTLTIACFIFSGSLLPGGCGRIAGE